MVDGRTRRVSRWLSLGLPALVTVLVSVIFGVTTASAELSLGPHEARYAVTSDATVTVDLGPLGTLQVDSPLPLTLGVRVTVQEIPASVTAVDASTTLQALGGDLQSYLQFFSGPQATIHDVTRALVTDAIRRSIAALVVLTGLLFAGRFMLGAARRDELAARLAPRAMTIVAAALVVVVALTVITSSDDPRDRPAQVQVASAVFDGTPLEGARVTGRLAGVIDTYGAEVVNAYRTNVAFYAAADAALVTAWTERKAMPDVAISTPLPDTSAAASPTPTSSATSKPAVAPKVVEPVVLLIVSDLHCNVGMAPLIRTAAEQSGAQVVLDAGDTTINGTAVEQYCVTTFRQAVPSGLPIVTSPGNHDSKETEAMYRHAGATVLDGKVVTVEGIRILGDSDPDETRIGAGTSAAGTETLTEEGSRLADTACDDQDGVDLLLIHNPRVGVETLRRGCAAAQISGHLHVRVGPAVVGSGVQYVSSSTAGAASGQPTVGPLHGIAEMTVLRFDPVSRRVMDYQLVQVMPDHSASVGPRIPWPHVVEALTPASGG